MPYNNMFYPPYPPIHQNYIFPNEPKYQNSNLNHTTNNYIPPKKETEIINFPQNKKDKEPSLLEKFLSNLNIELDDLIILGVLFFLYTEKCEDLYLYIALLLILLDIEIDTIIQNL